MGRLAHRLLVLLALALALLVVAAAGAKVTASKVRQVDVNKAGA